MVAQAIGNGCRVVSGGWHPWDLELGTEAAEYPARIRIQVKNSAALQPWNVANGKRSECRFLLSYRRRPEYLDADAPPYPCEAEGFLCDAFVLCHHPVTDVATADHTNPDQWMFYVLPVNGTECGVTDAELAFARNRLAAGARVSHLERRPATLERGIRNRPPLAPMKIGDLAEAIAKLQKQYTHTVKEGYSR
jgi:hypothetical protein